MDAVIYARYSSNNQREESIEGQIRECREFAEKNNLQIVDEYIDRAISGKTDNRPAFQRLIKDSSKGKFDVVIMYTLDRFARNRYDSAIYKAKLKKNGVRLLYAKQPMPDTPEGIILESVLEGYAEYYVENLRRGVKRGMRENALKGYVNGKTPLGYRRGKDKKYEIDPYEAKAVREIFERYARNEPIIDIIRWLNDNGYKTTTGGQFNKNSLRRILTNDKYIGVYRYDDIVIEDIVPPIIDRELFERVQSTFEYNKHFRAKQKAIDPYLLTGKLFCGHCGAMMIGESGTSRHGTTYRYYKCATRKREHACDKKIERKEWVERIVVEYAKNYVLTDENIEKIAEKVVELITQEYSDKSMSAELTARLDDVTTRFSNLLKALEQGVISESVANRVSELEKEKKSLEKKIATEKMSKPTITKDMVVYWLLSFKNGSIDDESHQRRIIDTLVNSVFIYDDDDGTARLVLNFNTSSNNNVTIKVSDTTSLAIPTIKSLENTEFISVSRLFHCFIYVRILSENRSQSFPIVPKSV
jgi:DNA invertase Pin-like site-specific DNA recombinase